MLKSKAFFSYFDPENVAPLKTVTEKVEDLVSLLEDGERRLQINRERSLKTIRQQVAKYLASGRSEVTAETQLGIYLS